MQRLTWYILRSFYQKDVVDFSILKFDFIKKLEKVNLCFSKESGPNYILLARELDDGKEINVETSPIFQMNKGIVKLGIPPFVNSISEFTIVIKK